MTMALIGESLEASIEGIAISVNGTSDRDDDAAAFAAKVNTNASLMAMGVKAVAASNNSGEVRLYYKNTKSLSQNTRITGQLSMTSKSGFDLQSSLDVSNKSTALADSILGGLVSRSFSKAGTSASLKFAANVEIDGAATNVDGTKAQAPSAFYDVKLDALGGAFDVNISSAEVGETNSALIAAGIAEKMRSQAPVPSITGVPIASLPPVGTFARFSIGDAEYTLERDTKGLKVSGPEEGRVFINTENVFSGGFSTTGEPVLLGQSITLSVNGGSLTGHAPSPLFDDNASLFGFGVGANYSSGSDKFSKVDPKVTHKAQSVLQGRNFTVPTNGSPTQFTTTVKNESINVTLTNSFNPTSVSNISVGSGDAFNQLTVASTAGNSTGFSVTFMGGTVSGTYGNASSPASADELNARALQLADLINANSTIKTAGGSAVASTNGTGMVKVEGTLSVTTDEIITTSGLSSNIVKQQTRVALDGVDFVVGSVTNTADDGYVVEFDPRNNKVIITGAPTGAGTLSIALTDTNGHILTANVDINGNETEPELAEEIVAAVNSASASIAGGLTSTSTNTDINGDVVSASVTLSGGQSFADVGTINQPGGGSISLVSNEITVNSAPTVAGVINFELTDTDGNSLAVNLVVNGTETVQALASAIKTAIDGSIRELSEGLNPSPPVVTDTITFMPNSLPDATMSIEGVSVTASGIGDAKFKFDASGNLTSEEADPQTQKNNYANKFAQAINENAALAALGVSALASADGSGDITVQRLSVSLTPANSPTAITLKADLASGPIKVTGGASATSLGFKVAESDLLVTEDGLTATSLNGLPVDLSGSGTSLAETRMQLTGLPTEELIVVVAGGGSRRISAKYTIDTDIAVDPLKKEQQYQVRMLDANSGRVELFDKATGHSIATRISNGNAQFDADGLRFNLNGYAATGDSFDVLTGQKAAGDARNMDEIMTLATSTVNRSSFQDDFRSIAASVGSTLESSRLSKLSAEAVRDAAVAAEDEVSGVNMDEEAAKLITQQQAYQAAARILQTAKEMFDTLMQIR
ncbi:MAG: flagellar basal body rod C-terminal domain-containing protein [Paracoccaceae bacterium]|nr:flagellar basal body rod C-terminal domain-containing protein [Paracoccaceae bacterium]